MSSHLRAKVIRLAYQNPDLRPVLLPLLRTASAVPRGVVEAAQNFMKWNRLSGSPEVQMTPTAITLTFPNWWGTARDLKVHVEKDSDVNLVGDVSEAIDSGEYVIDHFARVQYNVQENVAKVVIPLRPYDPDEDSAF